MSGVLSFFPLVLSCFPLVLRFFPLGVSFFLPVSLSEMHCRMNELVSSSRVEEQRRSAKAECLRAVGLVSLGSSGSRVHNWAAPRAVDDIGEASKETNSAKFRAIVLYSYRCDECSLLAILWPCLSRCII